MEPGLLEGAPSVAVLVVVNAIVGLGWEGVFARFCGLLTGSNLVSRVWIVGVLTSFGLGFLDLGRNKLGPNGVRADGVIPPVGVVEFSIVKRFLNLGR